VQTWLIVFVALVAIAVALQAIVLLAIYVQLRRTTQRVEQVSHEVQQRVLPLILRVQMLVEETQPRISSMLADSAEVTRLARAQMQRVDRVFGEAADRLRLQLIHADQILSGALDSVEETSTQIRRTVLGPLNSIIAVVRGVQTGIEFYRGIRRPANGSTEAQDENLFI
jgi:hypothetical protein